MQILSAGNLIKSVTDAATLPSKSMKEAYLKLNLPKKLLEAAGDARPALAALLHAQLDIKHGTNAVARMSVCGDKIVFS